MEVQAKATKLAAETPRSWSEFLESVREARDNLGNPKTVWYRGQSHSKFTLVPALVRVANGLQKEQALFDEYERSAARLLTKRVDDWELLIDMQHYGIPTRLLDWTDVLGIALAFALYNSNDDHEDSAIYVLDPLALNKESGLEEIKRVPNEKDFSYKSIYWRGKPLKASYPIAIDCALQNDRLVAQSGSFTVHGSKLNPIDEQVPGCIHKIVLSSSVKPEAREFLEYANLNAFSIYPDIVGMARHISRKHLGV